MVHGRGHRSQQQEGRKPGGQQIAEPVDASQQVVDPLGPCEPKAVVGEGHEL